MKSRFIIASFILSVASCFAQLSPVRHSYFGVDIQTEKFVTIVRSEEKVSLPKNAVIQIRTTEAGVIYFIISRNWQQMDSSELYSIEAKDFTEKYFSERASFSGSMLTTPFKYRPDEAKVYPGGNIAFAGSYTYSLLGFGLQPVAFAGFTTISIGDVNAGKVSTETKFGLTAGLGFQFNVVDAFSLGVVAGWDFIDKNWESDGKVWYAFSFNYSFIK